MASAVNRVIDIVTATKQYYRYGLPNRLQMVIVVMTNGLVHHVPAVDGNADYQRIMQFVEDGLLVLLEPPESETEPEPREPTE